MFLNTNMVVPLPLAWVSYVQVPLVLVQVVMLLRKWSVEASEKSMVMVAVLFLAPLLLLGNSPMPLTSTTAANSTTTIATRVHFFIFIPYFFLPLDEDEDDRGHEDDRDHGDHDVEHGVVGSAAAATFTRDHMIGWRSRPGRPTPRRSHV